MARLTYRTRYSIDQVWKRRSLGDVSKPELLKVQQIHRKDKMLKTVVVSDGPTKGQVVYITMKRLMDYYYNSEMTVTLD